MFSEFPFGDIFRILKNSQRIIYAIRGQIVISF